MLTKQESTEFLEFKPSEHEDATDGGLLPPLVNSQHQGGTCVVEDGEPILAELVAKFKRLQAVKSKWYTMVPTPFLCLIAFCVGFAVLSIVSIALVAVFVGGDDKPTTDDDDASEDGSVSASILLGIGMISSVVGSLQTASGYCAQRLGHQVDALARHHSPALSPRKLSRRHPLFYIGLLLLVCGTIAAVVNLGILGQSVTAPFAAMTLIFNGILAFTVLHEVITNYDIIATVLVLFGVGIAMLGVGLAELAPQDFVLSDIEAIFIRSLFPAVYSVVVLGSLVVFYAVVQKRHWQCKPAGLCCFSVGAGVLSGFSSLCVKCTVEVLKGVTQHDSGDLANPVLYLFVAGIPVCVLSQFRLMTLGLEHFGTFKFVPPYHAFIILSNLVNGMVYFDEAKGYDLQASCFFVAGCALTVGGVFVLLAKSPEEVDTDEEKAPRVSNATVVSEGDVELQDAAL